MRILRPVQSASDPNADPDHTGSGRINSHNSAVMYFGKIVELAESDELFDHPMHPYTKSLLSAIPLPDPDYEQRRREKKRKDPKCILLTGLTFLAAAVLCLILYYYG